MVVERVADDGIHDVEQQNRQLPWSGRLRRRDRGGGRHGWGPQRGGEGGSGGFGEGKGIRPQVQQSEEREPRHTRRRRPTCRPPPASARRSPSPPRGVSDSLRRLHRRSCTRRGWRLGAAAGGLPESGWRPPPPRPSTSSTPVGGPSTAPPRNLSCGI